MKKIKQTDLKSMKGFTLIELAIAIVIIGILAGSVVTAQSIIRSANIRSAIGEIEKMGTAIKAFQLEFDATPGTMRNAHDYFGDECGQDNTHVYYGCNGDFADRCIDASTSNSCQTHSNYQGDIRRLPLHLSMSGIYPDLPQVPDSRDEPDCNKQIPKSALDTDKIVSSRIPNKIFLYFVKSANGTPHGSICTPQYTSFALTPKTAQEIDKKIDNGNGRRGTIQSIYRNIDDSYSIGCMDAEGNYLLSQDEPRCGIRAELQ
jgi:prepilin-type N-terminal cleavage/methylation domain-containing protein